MKVIDLLNKIANGEIKHGTKFRIWFSKELYRDFYYDWYEACPALCLKNVSDDELFQDDYSFNDEVEIIEDKPKEDKKIEKLDLIFENKFIKEQFKSGGISYLDNYTTLKMIYEKQCEIIDKINEKEANNGNN